MEINFENIADISYQSELSRQLQENLRHFVPEIFEAFCCRG